MKYLSIVLLSLMLTACSTKPPVIIEKVSYVVRIPDEKLMTLPPYPPNINIEAASQADVANWVLSTEEYIQQLRNQIIEIGNFFKDIDK